MTPGHRLTPLDSPAAESAVPRLRGRTPIPPDEVRLSVLIPVYNEQSTLRLIVQQVRAVPVSMEVICVNDCSTDGSRAVLDELHEAGLVDVVVHIFEPHARAYYDLEVLWGDGPRVDWAAARGPVRTRRARGVPAGAELEYTDVNTIAQAMLDRRAA